VRRLLLLVGAIVLVDTMFFAAITPLLPYYSDRLDLTKAEAGVLAAAYPAGTLLAGLPAGWLAARAGVKPTVLVGLGGLAGSSLVFGVAENVLLLDAARFTQGLSGAASWAGALSWLVGAAPRERRGELIGSAFAAAIGGALLGPVLGATARATGPAAAFAGVAVLAAALFAWAVREPAAAPERVPILAGLRAAARNPAVVAGTCVIVLVGLFFGVVEVLLPLRLDELGASGAVIGAVFVGSSAVQALTSPLLGRLSDRRGRLGPIRASLLLAVTLALLLPLPEAVWPLALLGVVAGPTVGGLWVPGMALLSDGADAAGLHQGLAFALVNVAWASSQTVGAAGGGGAADALGDGAVYAALAAVMALALLGFLRKRGRVLH
jgi:MFS family permease